MALAEWGGQPISHNGVFKVLRRHGLNTRIRRLSLVAGYASPPVPEPQLPPKRLHLDAEKPGDLVQFDCFHIGRLTGTKGRVWQYTAIDVASSYVWAEVHRDDGPNPAVQYTSSLARRVADELAAAGWKLNAVLTDNGQEFRSHVFGNALRHTGAKQRSIRAGRPQTNGCVERVQRTILEEYWRLPSPGPWCSNTPPCAATWTSTCGTSTGTVGTPAGGAMSSLPPSWSMVPGRCAPDDRQLSGHLGGCSP
jgi:transposase InsO family protein